MHKKLEADLISLAHSILQMKNKEDVFALKEKSQVLYEKLSLLAFVEEYITSTPNLEKSKETLVTDIHNALENKKASINDKTPIAKTPQNHEIEQPFDELEKLLSTENPSDANFKNDVADVGNRKTLSLEDELKGTYSVEDMVSLFDKPTMAEDNLKTDFLKIDLEQKNDFIKYLFSNSHEDYNRVISQLNTFASKKEAIEFILNVVKPENNWENYPDLEKQLLEIIKRRFT